MPNMPLAFERSLYQAVIRFKAEHREELEKRTRQRKEKERSNKKDED